MEEDKPLWFVYLLLCDDKDFYVGITNNLNQRVLQHRSKLSKATKEYSTVELVYCEKYSGFMMLQNEKNSSKVGQKQRSKCLLMEN